MLYHDLLMKGKGGANTGELRPCIERMKAKGKHQLAARTACAMAMKHGAKGATKKAGKKYGK